MLLEIAESDEFAVVDDDMAGLAKYRWRLDRQGYVYRKVHGRRLYLHHFVLPGQRWPAELRDHINRNKLDNRRGNLRWLTAAESNQNRGMARRNRSGFRGVMPVRGRFRATAGLDGKVHLLGLFETAHAAAAAVSAWRTQHMPFAGEA